MIHVLEVIYDSCITNLFVKSSIKILANSFHVHLINLDAIFFMSLVLIHYLSFLPYLDPEMYSSGSF